MKLHEELRLSNKNCLRLSRSWSDSKQQTEAEKAEKLSRNRNIFDKLQGELKEFEQQ